MALMAAEGLAFFAGLNAIPKKSDLAEYSSRIDHAMTTKLLAAWQAQTRTSRTWRTGHRYLAPSHASLTNDRI